MRRQDVAAGMSATKLDLRSWKPTSTAPFFATWRTESRARCR